MPILLFIAGIYKVPIAWVSVRQVFLLLVSSLIFYFFLKVISYQENEVFVLKSIKRIVIKKGGNISPGII